MQLNKLLEPEYKVSGIFRVWHFAGGLSRWSVRCLCAGLLVALCPGVASATSIVYQDLGKAGLVRVAVTGAGPAWANRTIWAREYGWRSDSGAAGYEIYDPTLYTYGVSLLEMLANANGIATRSTDLLSVSGVPQASGRAAWRFNSYAPGIRSVANRTPADEVDATQSAIGLQVAMWAAMLDTSNDVLSGTFKLNSTAAIRTKAMSYLSALYTGGPSGYDAGAASWLDIDKPRDSIDLPGVPEPRSLALLATGVGALIAIGRRRQASRRR